MHNKSVAKTKNIGHLVRATSGSVSTMRKIRFLSRHPIVIGGCGRSGTTLLLSILSCHPNILAIDHETGSLSPFYWIDEPDYETFPQMRSIYEYLANHDINQSHSRWCEKTPKNVRYIGSILKYFGERTRFIHIVRDGRDVITSRHPSNPTQYYVSPQRWIDDVSAGLAFEANPQVFLVRYEDIVMDYFKTVKQICAFINEEFVNDMSAYPDCAKKQRDRAWSGKARPLDQSSIGRWKNEKYSDLFDRFVENRQAVSLLQRLGYRL